MMKKFYLLLILGTLLGCNSEDAGDCLQTAGKIIQVEVEVAPFTKITVHRRIALEIKEGPVQKVVVETGHNLQPDIDLQVVDNELVIRNYNECNFFRDYGITKVYVTIPNLTTIRNASELNITSNGILTYPNLFLISLGDRNKFLAVGDWNMHIENTKLKIRSNGIAVMNIKGSTDYLELLFDNGDPRLNAENLVAKKINLKQVSSNDMLLFPTEEISGTIHSTGDVIIFNKPPLIDVESMTSFGKLIIR